MMRIVAARAIRSSMRMPQSAFAPVVARNFFWGSKDDKDVPEIKVKIKTDREHQFGRRKEELDAAERGEEAFDNSSIVPPSDAGSWEKPIEIPSGMDQRAVGYEDPFTHQMKWFNLNVGEVAFVPEINLYFKIKVLH